MWEFVVHNVLPLVAAFGVGAAGWLTTNFVAKPILRFYELRESVLEAIYFTGNVYDPKEPRFEPAVLELRRISARLNALDVTGSRLVRWYLGMRGYNIMKAYQSITGLSNSMHCKDGTKAIHTHGIEKALRFPVQYSDADIQRIIERQASDAERLAQ